MQGKAEPPEGLYELADELRRLVGLKAAGRVELEFDDVGRLKSYWTHEKRVTLPRGGRGDGARVHSG